MPATRLKSPTLFERRVYAVVRRIPKGQTRSYRWVAQRLGNPRLARAVGDALNHNPWPFGLSTGTWARRHRGTRVPCHRVIHADGTLGGYAKGIAKKRALLQREGWTGRNPLRAYGILPGAVNWLL